MFFNFLQQLYFILKNTKKKRLFGESKRGRKHHNQSDVKIEKLKCILNYFKRVTSQQPKGCITFTRQFIEENNFPNFEKSTTKIRNAIIRYDGTIEDCKGASQVSLYKL
jgi:hypothetical protein